VAGRVDDARALRSELGDTAGLMMTALMDDQLGDVDKALDGLERVVATHNGDAVFLKIEHFTAAVRSHPRFQKLLEAMGFPESQR